MPSPGPLFFTSLEKTSVDFLREMSCLRRIQRELADLEKNALDFAVGGPVTKGDAEDLLHWNVMLEGARPASMLSVGSRHYSLPEFNFCPSEG